MQTKTTHYNSIFYPPGGILLWIIIAIEIFTFGLALIGLVHYARLEPEVFHQSRLELNATLGAINTVFLLASGYCMAEAVARFKFGLRKSTSRFINLAILGGVLFVVVKAFEYYQKIDAGHTMDSNMFFTFYWLLTGFHLVHVLVGMVILALINRKILSTKKPATPEDLEAGAAFWHMCDLIWLLLFPALYLIL